MKNIRVIAFTLAFVFASTLSAQTPREDIARNSSLSADNLMPYPAPPEGCLTPSPKGMQPFYISHYGRHGSRHLTRAADYDYPYDVLTHADADGKLTPLGRDVLSRIAVIREAARLRHGDLTPLGQEQCRGIAQRMQSRFPTVFGRGAAVTARSTYIPRCIFSMGITLESIARTNPGVTIISDGSEKYHGTLRRNFRAVTAKAAKEAYNTYCQERQGFDRLVQQLISDTAYIRRHVIADRIATSLFRVAGVLPGMDLGQEMTLYDLFTTDELYSMWQMDNASWFLGYGLSTLNGGDRPYSQVNLLRDILERADSVIANGQSGCDLRFGHETALLPLVVLMDINGFGKTIDDLNELETAGWVAYRVFPMASNLQMVFYRDKKQKKNQDDILVKVLLNEREATLPIESDRKPYYRWSDVRQYYTKILDDYDHRKH